MSDMTKAELEAELRQARDKICYCECKCSATSAFSNDD